MTSDVAMKNVNGRGYNPLCSMGRFIIRVLSGRIGSMPQYRDRTVTFPDGASFTVFRTMLIKSGKPTGNGAVFNVRFKPKSMSLAANRIFSLVPIPFFTGLPGFRAKCWMENRETGACSGVYWWDSAEAAESYSRSFAVKFMTRRSVPGSVSWNVVPGTTLGAFLENSMIMR